MPIHILSRILMTSLLVGAGVGHFIWSEKFLPAMPPWIPWHKEIIFWTGVLEIIFAALLWISSIRKTVSMAIAAYFLAILPAHFHVALNNVEMFGVSSAALLWFRLLLQFPLVYWAWSLRK